MKALVTAGGRGARLRPLTHSQNKHLIPVANRPILFYALDNIRAAGIHDVGIIVSPESADVVRDATLAAFAGRLNVTFIEQSSPRGLADCVKIARPFLGGEPFVFYLGDNMIVGGISRFVDRFTASHCDCFLTLARVPHPERFGVPELVDGKIVRVVEKPDRPASPFAVAGIYVYDAMIFEAVDSLQPSARGELEISDAHQYLIDHSARVDYAEITGWWKDTGTPEDLLEANRFALEHLAAKNDGAVDAASVIEGSVTIGSGARVVRSRITGPTIIGDRCVIEDSTIGANTSIGNDTIVRGTDIAESIVMDRSILSLSGSPLRGSIIGFDCSLTNAPSPGAARRVMVGDQSSIAL